MYLFPSSCHFHTVSENILYSVAYSVALRLHRICSTETAFNMKSDDYQNHLFARGHSKKRKLFLLFKLWSCCFGFQSYCFYKRGIVFFDVGIVLLTIDNDLMVLADLVQLWVK